MEEPQNGQMIVGAGAAGAEAPNFLTHPPPSLNAERWMGLRECGADG
jgi:hypothetical protein